MKDIKNITIMMSGTCNLQCKYCFINKTDLNALSEIDKTLTNNLLNGFYISQINKYIEDKKQINELQFWGGEPLLHLDDFSSVVDEWFKCLPNLSRFSMSTNLSLINSHQKIISFGNVLEEMHDKYCPSNKPFVISIQVSIDGPEEITDISRGVGTTKKIIDNYQKLCENWDCDPSKVVFNGHTHSTFTKECAENFLDIDNIKKYMDFFYEKFYIITKLFKPPYGFRFDPVTHASMVEPQKCTVLDGKNAEKIYKNIYLFINKYLNNLKYSSEYKRFIRRWSSTINPFDRFLHQINIKKMSIDEKISLLYLYKEELESHNILIDNYNLFDFCGKGRGSIVIGPEDNPFPVCHRGFFDVYQSYNRNLDKGKNDDFIGASDISSNALRWNFDNWNDFQKFRIASNYGSDILSEIQSKQMLYLYAKSGLIDKKYYLDKKELDFAAKYAFNSINCIQSNIEITGSMFVGSFYNIKYYFNGAFDWMCKLTVSNINREINRLIEEKEEFNIE